MQEARRELQKVAWPTFDDVAYNAALLFACVVLLVAVIAGFDGGLARATTALFG